MDFVWVSIGRIWDFHSLKSPNLIRGERGGFAVVCGIHALSYDAELQDMVFSDTEMGLISRGLFKLSLQRSSVERLTLKSLDLVLITYVVGIGVIVDDRLNTDFGIYGKTKKNLEVEPRKCANFDIGYDELSMGSIIAQICSGSNVERVSSIISLNEMRVIIAAMIVTLKSFNEDIKVVQAEVELCLDNGYAHLLFDGLSLRPVEVVVGIWLPMQKSIYNAVTPMITEKAPRLGSSAQKGLFEGGRKNAGSFGMWFSVQFIKNVSSSDEQRGFQCVCIDGVRSRDLDSYHVCTEVSRSTRNLFSKVIVEGKITIMINGDVNLEEIAHGNGNCHFELGFNVKIVEVLLGSPGFMSKGPKALKVEASCRFNSGLWIRHAGISNIAGSFQVFFKTICWNVITCYFDWIYLSGNDLYKGNICLIMKVEECCCPEDTGAHGLGDHTGLTMSLSENRNAEWFVRTASTNFYHVESDGVTMESAVVFWVYFDPDLLNLKDEDGTGFDAGSHSDSSGNWFVMLGKWLLASTVNREVSLMKRLASLVFYLIQMIDVCSSILWLLNVGDKMLTEMWNHVALGRADLGKDGTINWCNMIWKWVCKPSSRVGREFSPIDKVNFGCHMGFYNQLRAGSSKEKLAGGAFLEANSQVDGCHMDVFAELQLCHYMVYLLLLITMGFVRHVPSLKFRLFKAPG